MLISPTSCLSIDLECLPHTRTRESCLPCHSTLSQKFSPFAMWFFSIQLLSFLLDGGVSWNQFPVDNLHHSKFFLSFGMKMENFSPHKLEKVTSWNNHLSIPGDCSSQRQSVVCICSLPTGLIDKGKKYHTWTATISYHCHDSCFLSAIDANVCNVVFLCSCAVYEIVFPEYCVKSQTKNFVELHVWRGELFQPCRERFS